MYIDNTIELVNHEYVEKNKTLMQNVNTSNYRLSDDDAYEFDTDGDLMSLALD